MPSNARRWKGERADSVFIATLLANARKEKPTGSLTLYFARQFLGRPYVAHTLEVADDRTVVVNTRQLDCTTLVENVVALTLCVVEGKYTFRDFVDRIERLRYRGGRMDGYCSRLHYFTDWIDDNSQRGNVSERQSPNPPFGHTQVISVGYMSSHPTLYKALREHPEYVKEISKGEDRINGKKYRYIAKDEVKNTSVARSAVRDGDIIAITTSKKGLDIAHLGFAVWKSDGLHLLNASMIHKKVVTEPMTLRQYLMRHKSHTGIRVIKVKAPSSR